MKKKLRWRNIVTIICVVAFLVIAAFVVKKDSLFIDRVGYKFVSSFISDFKTPIVRGITNFGSEKIVIPLFLILLVIFFANKKVKYSLLLGFCLFFQVILNFILKHIIRRNRPSVLRLVEQGGYSFPSGHTMASCAFYGYLMYIIYKKVENKYLKWGSIVFLSMFVFLIGCSRIYLGVHYTSDVLAGFLISIAYLIIFIGLTRELFEEK